MLATIAGVITHYLRYSDFEEPEVINGQRRYKKTGYIKKKQSSQRARNFKLNKWEKKSAH